MAITPEKQIENLNKNQPEQAGVFVVKETKEQVQSREKTKQVKEIKTEKKPEGEKFLFFKKSKKTILPLKKNKDEITVKVEKIMEEGLRETYEKMPPIVQQEFKIKGEETAEKISHLLKKTHVKIKKIFALIFAWLKMIPGINYFFLEQEAKIKTDRILALKKMNEK